MGEINGQELYDGSADGEKQEVLKDRVDIEIKSLMIHLIAEVWMKKIQQSSFLGLCIVQLGHSIHGDEKHTAKWIGGQSEGRF